MVDRSGRNDVCFGRCRQCEDAIADLRNDNEQLEQEKTALKERLKQLTKTKLVDDLMQKKMGATPRGSVLLSGFRQSRLGFLCEFSFVLGPTVDGRVSPQRQLSPASATDGSIVSPASEHEVSRFIHEDPNEVDRFRWPYFEIPFVF